jgi:hypothetical protein
VENPGTEIRAATVTVTAGALQATITVGQAQGGGTPPYAASPRTWLFGEQTWSDAIRIPECNKNGYDMSFTEPQCRSYTSGTNTWYYYNWPYVHANGSTLCPSPWRVPSQSDFSTLAGNANAPTLGSEWGSEWGTGGYANDINNVSQWTNTGNYWSSTESGDSRAYHLWYNIDNDLVSVQVTGERRYGFQVRCVK